MSWLSHVGLQAGKIKDLWGGRGFQKNSIFGYAGYVLPAYWGAQGANAATSGYQSLFMAKGGATGTATAQQAANANSRESNIQRGEAVGHDVAPQYISDPTNGTAPIEMPSANDPAILASGQAEQQAALQRQRRQRLAASVAGGGSQFFLGRAPLIGDAKTLLGS